MTNETTSPQSQTGSGNLLVKLLVGLVVLCALAIGVQGYYIHRIHGQLNRMMTVAKAPAKPSASPAVRPMVMDADRDVPSFADPSDIFREFQWMRERMDRLFGETLRQFHSDPMLNLQAPVLAMIPDLDLRDEKDRYVIRIDVPGMDKTKMSVQLDGQTLTIAGNRDETLDQKDGGKTIHHERRVGSFERRLHLPGPVKADGVQAKCENGMLTITVAKDKTANASNQIKVN